jgi:hypothetical protein
MDTAGEGYIDYQFTKACAAIAEIKAAEVKFRDESLSSEQK